MSAHCFLVVLPGVAKFVRALREAIFVSIHKRVVLVSHLWLKHFFDIRSITICLLQVYGNTDLNMILIGCLLLKSTVKCLSTLVFQRHISCAK